MDMAFQMRADQTCMAKAKVTPASDFHVSIRLLLVPQHGLEQVPAARLSLSNLRIRQGAQDAWNINDAGLTDAHRASRPIHFRCQRHPSNPLPVPAAARDRASPPECHPLTRSLQSGTNPPRILPAQNQTSSPTLVCHKWQTAARMVCRCRQRLQTIGNGCIARPRAHRDQQYPSIPRPASGVGSRVATDH